MSIPHEHGILMIAVKSLKLGSSLWNEENIEKYTIWLGH